MRKNNPDRWHFTVETNAKGLSYVYAYQTQWDPVKKQSHRSAKRYAGRLHEDGRVSFGKRFLEDFPAYAEGDFYYGADKTLVDETAYRKDFPEAPGPKPEEEQKLDETLNAGVTWAAEAIADQSGMLCDLKDVFGEDAGDLLALAVYKLDGGGPMAAYEDWRRNVYLKSGGVLSSQRISELMSTVTQKKIESYFALRHKRILEKAKNRGEKTFYALDNTSVSTYSATIDDAEFGHAKRDPELRQINYTFVCDQATGDIAYAHSYAGSVNDVTALSDILYRMKGAGLDLEDTVLVTDRGYGSLCNVQRMVNLELRFIQGVRKNEDSVLRAIDRYSASLRDMNFYNSRLEVYARTIKEDWSQNTDFGRISRPVYVHLYRFPGGDELEMKQLMAKVDDLLEGLNEGRKQPDDLWRSCKRFVEKTADRNGRTVWVRNYAALQDACRYAGIFVLRTNEEEDPFRALWAYRLRGRVELDFNQFKNQVDGDRLRSTQTGYLGKLFVCTLAAAIRLMMLKRAHDSREPGVFLPHNSIDCLLAKLRCLKADKRLNGNAWVMRTITKKQRDYLSLLLSVPLPPKVLR
ncbi:MAG: DDE-Tnp-1 domain-containing protein [Burkholderia sp.]|jgi:hypothetical protein